MIVHSATTFNGKKTDQSVTMTKCSIPIVITLAGPWRKRESPGLSLKNLDNHQHHGFGKRDWRKRDGLVMSGGRLLLYSPSDYLIVLTTVMLTGYGPFYPPHQKKIEFGSIVEDW